jgi:hypothetical protein
MVKITSSISLAEYLESNFGKSTKKRFTAKDKIKLRPIAETLALMDGNAFFGIATNDAGDDTWYEEYLPEAYLIYKSNGGDNGWSGLVSWMKQINHENDCVKTAYQEWQLVKALSRKDKN